MCQPVRTGALVPGARKGSLGPTVRSGYSPIMGYRESSRARSQSLGQRAGAIMVGVCTLLGAWTSHAWGGEATTTPAAEAAARYASLEGRPLRRIRRRMSASCCYLPTLPQPESRASFLATALPPTVEGLTAGEALTPLRGRFGLDSKRISDERPLRDNQRRRWTSDGEVRVITMEVVSPRARLRLGELSIPLHVSASLHAYTLSHPLWDGVRNYLEDTYFGSDQIVKSIHDIGGRALDVDGDAWLDADPMFKVRLAAKFPLPCFCAFGRPVDTALSIGATLPAFGSKSSTGNDEVVPDVALAWRVPIRKNLFLGGSASASFAGATRRLEDLGYDTTGIAARAGLDLEWWFHRRWAAMVGFSWNFPWVENTGLPMDVTSSYFELGFLHRLTRRDALYLTFSENPQTGIAIAGTRDFSNAQTDADFTVQLGWRHDF